MKKVNNLLGYIDHPHLSTLKSFQPCSDNFVYLGEDKYIKERTGKKNATCVLHML